MEKFSKNKKVTEKGIKPTEWFFFFLLKKMWRLPFVLGRNPEMNDLHQDNFILFYKQLQRDIKYT